MWKIILLVLAACAVGQICPLGGPAFPAPREARRTVALAQARRSFTESLENILSPANGFQNPTIDPDMTSFTIQVYSAHDSKPLYDYYHTATSVQKNDIGVQCVEENTVFRIGSVSKLWAVLVLLIESGDATFHEPVAKYIPEVQQAIIEQKANPEINEIDHLLWDQVTIGELASQLSGFERSFGVNDLSENPSLAESLGLPELSDTAVPGCGLSPTCNRTQFFSGPAMRHPIVPTSSTPIYSNDAFQLLGYVLEAVSNKTTEEVFDQHLINRLGLSNSSYAKPGDNVGVIPGLANETMWDLEMGDITPTGGVYSSTKDMSTLGRAILNHELLSAQLTRRWMKPRARTADPNYSVGAPWEIFTLHQNRMIDLYTKGGDIGAYSAIMGFSPDHDMGFNILAAGQGTVPATRGISDIVANIMIPGLEEAAREEAMARFGGRYTSGTDSLTLTTDEHPGLKITDWQSNGKSMLDSLSTLQTGQPNENIDVRLYPTGLKTSNKISFRSVLSGLPSPVGPPNGPMTSVCNTWLLVDGLVYGSVGVDEFVFDLGGGGAAISVSPRALRTWLKREWH